MNHLHHLIIINWRHEPHIEELSLPSRDVVHVHVGDGDREHVLVGVVVVIIVILADFVPGVDVVRDLKILIKFWDKSKHRYEETHTVIIVVVVVRILCVCYSEGGYKIITSSQDVQL